MNAEPERADSADAAVGRRIHMLMWDRRLTQTELAPRLGIEQSALSKKLRGQRGWSVDELLAAAAYLHTSVSYLTGEEDTMGSPPRFRVGSTPNPTMTEGELLEFRPSRVRVPAVDWNVA